MMGLTHRQTDLLNFIRNEAARTGGILPTLEEMAAHLGLQSKSSAHRLLVGLEERGAIQRLPNRARALDGSPRTGFTTISIPDSAHAAALAGAKRDSMTVNEFISRAVMAASGKDK